MDIPMDSTSRYFCEQCKAWVLNSMTHVCNSTQTFISYGAGSGYWCKICGWWVVDGETHICPNTIKTTCPHCGKAVEIVK